MAAVEVEVRFAGTLLAVRRVRPHERFVIGTAPEVDLPLPGHTAFPLVDRNLAVRVPIGVEADYAFGRTELVFGLVAIALARVDDAPAHVPRPPAQKRIVPFFAAALAVHVALVAVAMATTAPDDIAIPVVLAEHPRRVLPKTLPPPAPKPDPKRAAKQAARVASAEPAAAESGATTVQQAREAARKAGVLGSASLDDLSMITGSVDLAEAVRDLGPVWDEAAAIASGFGGAAGNFDPSQDPAFDSVKTGRYATNGNAGASYRLPSRGRFREVQRPPIMGLTCDDNECKTIGTLDRGTIRDHVERRYVDMVKCFERHARNTDRIELKLHFEIGSDGTPNEVHADQPTGFSSCLVRIVERTKFPADKPTQVTYPVAFWRT